MRPILPTPRGEFLNGLRVVAPSALAIGAWGLVTGVAMVKTGLSIDQAIGMTLLVFAGSAQLAALPLIAAVTPVWVILVTAIVINLRFVIYAAALAPHFRHLSPRVRLFIGYITSDVGFVLFVPRVEAEPDRPYKVWFFAGCSAGNWISWQIMSLLGIALASQIPSRWGLDLAGTLALAALGVPLINSRPAVVGVAVTGAIALLGAQWPLRLGLIAAVAGGIVAALLAESRQISKEVPAT